MTARSPASSPRLTPGEVVVADRGFCGWGLLALLKAHRVDAVMRLHQCRADQPGQTFVTWARPQRTKTWAEELWHTLPTELPVRLVRFRVEVPGFRTEQITLVTTLLDTMAYPDEAIIALYRQRWLIEGHYRDLKVTLGLDVLRTCTPEMIERELWMQAIAYNLVRAVLIEAADQHAAPLARLSFKGALTAMRQFTPLMSAATTSRERAPLYAELLATIAADRLPLRPDRSEPRAVKRRPKVYQLMTRPRHEMRVSASRRQK
jgi:hypothetical protein